MGAQPAQSLAGARKLFKELIARLAERRVEGHKLASASPGKCVESTFDDNASIVRALALSSAIPPAYSGAPRFVAVTLPGLPRFTFLDRRLAAGWSCGNDFSLNIQGTSKWH
ncbi:MAG TPA: hypothetical protein VLW55_28630 [Burkholderiaceae bacterium]|nr:hypothetical protein [Burkholderiaceae bacterium]